MRALVANIELSGLQEAEGQRWFGSMPRVWFKGSDCSSDRTQSVIKEKNLSKREGVSIAMSNTFSG